MFRPYPIMNRPLQHTGVHQVTIGLALELLNICQGCSVKISFLKFKQSLVLGPSSTLGTFWPGPVKKHPVNDVAVFCSSVSPTQQSHNSCSGSLLQYHCN